MFACRQPITGFHPRHEQQQQILPTLDLNPGPNWEFNLGVGVGLTRSTDPLPGSTGLLTISEGTAPLATFAVFLQIPGAPFQKSRVTTLKLYVDGRLVTSAAVTFR